jgi:hypothetical protein
MVQSRTLRVLFGVSVAAVMAVSAVFIAGAAKDDGPQNDLAKVRAAVAGYRQVDAAEDAGWVLVPGLDHCFPNMGIHYIKGPLDTSLDPLEPEALVYQHLPNGELRLGAVEYIVPAAAWDAENHGHDPEVLGRHLHLNSDLGVYVLHAWLFNHNPDGMYLDTNQRVNCP